MGRVRKLGNTVSIRTNDTHDFETKDYYLGKKHSTDFD
jgi:hypothetical protein